MRRFNVVVSRADGGVEVHPMKEWLRQNAQHVRPGMSATSNTSHELRNALKKRGWQVQESADEERLFMPGESNTEAIVDAVLGVPGESTPSDEASEGSSFALEAQLRDFIVQNLGRIPINGKRVSLIQTRPVGPEWSIPPGLGQSIFSVEMTKAIS